MDIPLSQTPGFETTYVLAKEFLESYSESSKKLLFQKEGITTKNESILPFLYGAINTQEIVEYVCDDIDYNQEFVLELIVSLAIDNEDASIFIITNNGHYNHHSISSTCEALLNDVAYSISVTTETGKDPSVITREVLDRICIAHVVELSEINKVLHRIGTFWKGVGDIYRKRILMVPVVTFIFEEDDDRSLKLNSGLFAIKLKAFARQLNCAIVTSTVMNYKPPLNAAAHEKEGVKKLLELSYKWDSVVDKKIRLIPGSSADTCSAQLVGARVPE